MTKVDNILWITEPSHSFDFQLSCESNERRALILRVRGKKNRFEWGIIHKNFLRFSRLPFHRDCLVASLLHWLILKPTKASLFLVLVNSCRQGYQVYHCSHIRAHPLKCQWVHSNLLKGFWKIHTNMFMQVPSPQVHGEQRADWPEAPWSQRLSRRAMTMWRNAWNLCLWFLIWFVMLLLLTSSIANSF